MKTKKKIKSIILASMAIISMSASASGYSDYLEMIQTEADNFNPKALSLYVVMPDYITTEEKLQKKLIELQGFWSNVIPDRKVVKVNYEKIDAKGYLMALSDSENVKLPRKFMTPKEATELRELENDIIFILNEMGKMSK